MKIEILHADDAPRCTCPDYARAAGYNYLVTFEDEDGACNWCTDAEDIGETIIRKIEKHELDNSNTRHAQKK